MELVNIVETGHPLFAGVPVLMVYSRSEIMSRPGKIDKIPYHTVFGTFRRFAESGYMVLGSSVEMVNTIDVTKLKPEEWLKYFRAVSGDISEKKGENAYPLSDKSIDDVIVYTFG